MTDVGAHSLNVLSLCAGIGAMDVALAGVARGVRTVCYVEREAYAVAVLAARMADGRLHPAPVWTDLETFDGRPWRGVVDCVAASLPCQPYSVAGDRRGDDDERALWPELGRIVGECEPGVVFLENVPGFIRASEPLWRQLRGMGFVWAPPLFATASHYGAPHIRERAFLLAARRGVGIASPDADGGRREGEWRGWLFDRERQVFRHDVERCRPGCRTCGTEWASESPPARLDARPPHSVDRLRATGNALVPRVARAAFRELLRCAAAEAAR